MASRVLAQTPAQPSVREILNADGSVRLDREGGYDVEGYKMLIDKDGRPRFLSKTEDALSDSGNWSAVGSGSNIGVYGGDVYAMAVYNGKLYIGGNFIEAGGISSNGIGCWDGTSWLNVGTGVSYIGSYQLYIGIYAMAVYNGELYVGGKFDIINGLQAKNIACWNGNSWKLLGDSLNNGVTGVNTGNTGTMVKALAVFNNELYVAGDFEKAGGLNSKCIAKWNGNNWSIVGTGNDISMNSDIKALAVYNGKLYVGGQFQMGSSNAKNIASWDGTSWNTLGNGSNNGVNGYVKALAVYNGELYVGGDFSQAGGQSFIYKIARWNGSSWNIVGTSAFNNGVDGYINSLFVYNNELYVGGRFLNAGGNTVNRIARWNGSNWKSLGSAGNVGVGGLGSEVMVMTNFNGELYVGGSFPTAGGINVNKIARWTISGATGVEENEITPTNFILHQNYPNPFNPSTTISFTLPKASYVTLKVYDMLGKEVATLVNGRQAAGSYHFNFNASNLASGVYFYRLQAGNFVQTKKMMLVK